MDSKGPGFYSSPRRIDPTVVTALNRLRPSPLPDKYSSRKSLPIHVTHATTHVCVDTCTYTCMYVDAWVGCEGRRSFWRTPNVKEVIVFTTETTLYVLIRDFTKGIFSHFPKWPWILFFFYFSDKKEFLNEVSFVESGIQEGLPPSSPVLHVRLTTDLQRPDLRPPPISGVGPFRPSWQFNFRQILSGPVWAPEYLHLVGHRIRYKLFTLQKEFRPLLPESDIIHKIIRPRLKICKNFLQSESCD